MGQRQELTTVVGPPPEPDAPPPPEELPPEGEGTKEQEPTPPTGPDAASTVVATDKRDAADQPDVLSEPAAAEEVDRVTNDEEAAHLFLVFDGPINHHGAASVDKKDADHVKIHQDGGESRVQNIGSPRGFPSPLGVAAVAPRKKKKLLILDLNGLLADINQDKHNAHLSHGKFRGKLVFKRPYYDDFLRFCIQHFELGIWSSRLRANVDAVVDILMKDLKHHLLFCWDLSRCTRTGLKTLENKVKPLVLKELKKLWDKEETDDLPWQQGEFSPSNTLLVDDSPYKALRNPPHTAIFPCPYSYKNDKDDALGPGGDLRLYLESLATADDVQRFVREHPFGQPPITETHPDWNFYRQVLVE